MQKVSFGVSDFIEPAAGFHKGAAVAGAVRRVLFIAPDHNVRDERVLRTIEAAATCRCFLAVDPERATRDGDGRPALPPDLQARFGGRVALLALPERHRIRFVYRFLLRRFARAVAALARSLGVDLVHIHESGSLGLLIAREVRRLIPGARVIFDYHDWIPYEIALVARNRDWLYRRLLSRSLRVYQRRGQAVDTVVCISEGQAAWVREVLGVRQTLVVPNVRPALPGPLPEPEKRGPRLLFVGHIMRMRRVEDVVDVLARLRAEGISAHLDLCGSEEDSGYFAELRRYAEARGARDALSFHGKYRDDQDLLGTRSEGTLGVLLSHPQRIETGIHAISSANKFYSYLSLGIPVLLDRSFSDMARILETYDAGRSFATLDECVRQALSVWHTAGTWTTLSRNARRAAEEMNSAAYMPALAELYR